MKHRIVIPKAFVECVIPEQHLAYHRRCGGRSYRAFRTTERGPDGYVRVFVAEEPFHDDGRAQNVGVHISVSIGGLAGNPTARPTDAHCRLACSLVPGVKFTEENHLDPFVRQFWEE